MTDVTEKFLIKSMADNRDKGRRYSFLLGAGASITSGIKGAGQLAKQWLEEIEALDPEGYQKIITDNSFNKDNVAASYTRIYQNRFKHFPDDGYREIEELMSDEKVQPSFGYTVLAQVLKQTRHNVVLTTNFDRLTETALLYYQNTHARVIAHEEMLNVIAIHDQKPSIVKIHRDMQFSPMSEEQEVEQLDPKWNEIVRALLSQYNLVCLGYGGNDNGLMDVLKQELNNTPKAKVYWCYRGKITQEIQALKQAFPTQLKLVNIAGFDEFMLQLNQALHFKPLSKHIETIAEQRKHSYDQQLTKLTESTTDNGNLSAVKELLAETWWEVQVEINKEPNIEIKDKIYQKGLEKFPESPELIGNYAIFLENNKKDYDKAEQYYLKAIVLAPEDADFNGNYAIFLKNVKKDYGKAEPYYLKALERNPEHAHNTGNYANFLSDIKKDYDKAEQYYLKALEIDPEHANNNGNYANFLHEDKKDYDKAELYYLKALALDPESSNKNGNYALFLHENKKDYDKAEQHYLKALALDPESSNKNSNYALFLHENRKDYDKAEQHYLKALEVDSEDANLNGNYALFLKNIKKDYNEAEQYYLKALGLASEDADFNGNYAIFLNDIKKDYDKAKQHYLKALENSPEDANHNGNYASSLLQQDKINQALPYLEKAEQLVEDSEQYLKLELAFYRLALFPQNYTTSKATIEKLLAEGHTSPGWDFSGIIAQAKQQGNNNITELEQFAEKISAI